MGARDNPSYPSTPTAILSVWFSLPLSFFFFFLCDSHSICHGNVIAPDRGKNENNQMRKKKKRKEERNSNAKRQDELRFKWSFELGVRRRSGEDARTQAMRRVSQDEAAPGRAHPRLAEMEKQA